MKWLVEETQPIDPASQHQLVEALAKAEKGQARAAANLAIRLRNIVIHDTKKLFGVADIRLDTLVVHGQSRSDSFYQPTTHRFPGVRDRDRLPIDDSGLLVFYGLPRHFVDISITVSRDRKDTNDLVTLLTERLTSPQFKTTAATIIGLTSIAPHAAAIVAAVGAAATLGNLAAEILLRLTGNTIGLYHASYLQYRDRFGLGRHPDEGEFHIKDFSFSYDVVIDKSIPAPDAR